MSSTTCCCRLPGRLQLGDEPHRLRSRGADRDDAAWLTKRDPPRGDHRAASHGSDGPIGTLVAGAGVGEVRSFTTDDTRLLASVGEQVSVAIRHAELLEQLQHASDHDPLTGLGQP